jgi:predicted nucleic acid-binding protein
VEIIEDRIAAILPQDAIGAAQLADAYPTLDARDLIHLAVMRRLGVPLIISADTGFDRVPEVERLAPGRFEEWRDSI